MGATNDNLVKNPLVPGHSPDYKKHPKNPNQKNDVSFHMLVFNITIWIPIITCHIYGEDTF